MVVARETQGNRRVRILNSRVLAILTVLGVIMAILATAPSEAGAADPAAAPMSQPMETTVPVTDSSEAASPLAVGPPPSDSFLGSAFSDGRIPPDTQGAVGLSHLMTVTNGSVIVQQRDGTVLSTATLDGFFGDLGVAVDEAFDPRVLYDHDEQRWLVVAADWREHANSRILLAVSKTIDPTGEWSGYTIDADPDDLSWADYPIIAFNANWIVVSTILYTHEGAWDKNMVITLHRDDLYDDDAAITYWKLDGGGTSAMVPAFTPDYNVTTMYLLQRRNGNEFGLQGSLRLYEITGTMDNPVIDTGRMIPTGSTWFNGDTGENLGPQLGATTGIHTGDDRVRDVVYENGVLYVTQTVHLPAENPNRSAIQVWQFVPSHLGLTNVCRLDDPDGDVMRAWPSLALAGGKVVIGYSRFSADTYASAAYSVLDTPCDWFDEVIFKEGEAPYVRLDGKGRNRWGDYSSTVWDPRHDEDVWTIQEYAASPANTWGTWWARVPLRPHNDDYGDWTPILPPYDNPTTVTQTTHFATTEPDENLTCADPDVGGESPYGATVWYAVHGETHGDLVIDTIGSDFDTVLAVYQGSFFDHPRVACDDDPPEAAHRQSSVIVPSNEGVTGTYIQVGGYDNGDGGAQGTLVLNIRDYGPLPPWWPDGSTITATSIQRNQVTVTWTPAADDAAVVEYALYLDHQLVGTTKGLSYTFTGLDPATQYHFSVEAGDAEDQWTRGEGPGRYVTTASGFVDTGGTTFEGDIDWLAAQGITKGCNPPVNDRFCPNDYVTRGQMAAFLVRALGYTDNGGGDLFIDDNGSVFEDSIDRLGTAGVTKGCNPPVNDRFCPNDYVTRGQMAAFLVRALGYTDNGGGDLFIDDNGSVFEDSIDRLGTAGVTKGCNPPVNDRFCPHSYVTRGQMAAFLRRALS